MREITGEEALVIMHGDCWPDCLRPAARWSGEREREGGQRGRLTDARLGILPSTERETRLCPGPFRQAPDPHTNTHTHTQSHARTHACAAQMYALESTEREETGRYPRVFISLKYLLAPETV